MCALGNELTYWDDSRMGNGLERELWVRASKNRMLSNRALVQRGLLSGVLLFLFLVKVRHRAVWVAVRSKRRVKGVDKGFSVHGFK